MISSRPSDPLLLTCRRRLLIEPSGLESCCGSPSASSVLLSRSNLAVCESPSNPASPSNSRTSTQHFGKMPEKTLASSVCPLRLVKPASSDGGATRYPLYQDQSFPPSSIMYSSSPISSGRSAVDEGWKGKVDIAKAIRDKGLHGMSNCHHWRSSGGRYMRKGTAIHLDNVCLLRAGTARVQAECRSLLWKSALDEGGVAVG